MTDDDWVGARIRRLREAKGLTLSGLAALASVSKGNLHGLETEPDSNPTIDVLKRIADALDVTIADLLAAPKTRARLELPENIPPGLKELVETRKALGQPLEIATIAWLANANFRGKRPTTKMDFEFLLESLQRSSRGSKK